MAAPKGNSFSNGRPKGSKNKVTLEMKKAFKLLVDGNLGKMQSWIDRTAEKDPAKAMQLMLDMSERFLPKLARTEVTGKDGEDFKGFTVYLPNKNTNDDTTA